MAGDQPNNWRPTDSNTPAHSYQPDHFLWRAAPSRNWWGASEVWSKTDTRGGRPTQELAGDQPNNWPATNPPTGGRPTQELAGDQPKNWRATNPRTGGYLAQELESFPATLPRLLESRSNPRVSKPWREPRWDWIKRAASRTLIYTPHSVLAGR